MLPLGFLKMFYMVFIGMFLTVYFATTVVVVHAARVGDLPPALIGWGLAMLSVVLVALALDELRKLVLRQ
jgi:amino acid transporter